METLIIILAILAGVIGIAGSILPGLPGTPVSWVGLLLLYIWGPEEMALKTLIVWGVVVAIVSVIDYIVPMYFTKLTGGSRYAERGAMAQTHFTKRSPVTLNAKPPFATFAEFSRFLSFRVFRVGFVWLSRRKNAHTKHC